MSHINIGPVPDSVTNMIQCMNSNLIPAKFETYQIIKTYLDSNVFEGIRYNELIQNQNLHTDNWFDIFTDKKKLEPILEKNIKETDLKCDHMLEWNNLF